MFPSAEVPLPRVKIDLDKLRHNLNTLLDLCHSSGIEPAVVTKVVCADPQIVRLIEDSPAAFYADSRWENLKLISETCPESRKLKILLRIAGMSQIPYVVRYADASLQSELCVIKALGAEAEKAGKVHKIILMADMGDLREGIFHTDKESILETARYVSEHSFLELWGIGVNLTCYGAIIPSEQNLGGLCSIAEELRRELNEPIPVVSGGNSSSLFLIKEGRMPAGINNLRLGESFVLGNDTAGCCLMEGLFGDAFILEAEIAECRLKPSKPEGESGANAFGERVVYPDRGPMHRAIAALGRQDVNAENLIPYDRRLEILGASSDHLLINLGEAASDYKVGDVLQFSLDYGNLLRVFTSRYVNKMYI